MSLYPVSNQIVRALASGIERLSKSPLAAKLLTRNCIVPRIIKPVLLLVEVLLAVQSLTLMVLPLLCKPAEEQTAHPRTTSCPWIDL